MVGGAALGGQLGRSGLAGLAPLARVPFGRGRAGRCRQRDCGSGQTRNETSRRHPGQYMERAHEGQSSAASRPPARGPERGDRPREKLVRVGATSLGDNELLAIVLGGGTAGTGALSLANVVLATAGGLQGLLRMTPDDLRGISGVGAARSAQILAALELGRRSLVRKPPARAQIGSPRDIVAFLLPEYGGRPVEHFGVVLLDTKHRVLRTVILSVGGSDSTPVQPREVFRHATAAAAAAIVVFHNHPSGDPTPSGDDIALTRRLAAAGVLMGTPVLDHVVIGDGRYCSFKEIGIL